MLFRSCAGSVVLKNVPPNATVVGIPGRVVVKDGVRVDQKFDHHNLPDPVDERCNTIEREIEKLKEELMQLKKKEVRDRDGDPNI